MTALAASNQYVGQQGAPDAGLSEESKSDVSSGLKVTIIEDDEALGRTLATACRGVGFDTSLITDEETYHRQRTQAVPDVLLLDLNIGFGTGLDCLERYISQGFQGYTVLMSGCDDRVFRFSEDICRKLGAKVLASLQKPFELKELTEILTPILPEAPVFKRHEFHDALTNNEIVPYFQPIMNIQKDELAGAEILARWLHPQHGLIQPNRFIGPFEEFGLMKELTNTVLDRGIREIRELMPNEKPINLSVNVSPSILLEPGFSDRFIQTITNAGGQPEDIKIEITESVAFAGIERIMRVLTRLRIEGVKISIDDFGTGYSSLTALHQLPFSDLKIDRSFTNRIIHDPEAEKIVHSLIDLAQSLGLEVVAEGAEVSEIIDILKEKKCDMAQGYFFAKPLIAQNFIDWRNKNKKS